MAIDPKTFEPADMAFAGRTLFITGASDGIGKALALRCAGLGAKVLLAGRSAEKLGDVSDAIIEAGGLQPTLIALDFLEADGASFASLGDGIAAENQQLDGLVHNAGLLGDLTPFEHYDLVQWQKVMHVNLTAAVALTQVLLPLLKKAPTASLIFSSSSVGRQGRAFWGAYAVSKFATEGFAQVLADENQKTGLRVNCVNPGGTRTGMRLKAYPAEDRSKLPTPDQVLGPYLYLLSDESLEVNGQSLNAQ